MFPACYFTFRPDGSTARSVFGSAAGSGLHPVPTGSTPQPVAVSPPGPTCCVSDLHSPLGILSPSGSKRSAESAASQPASRIRPISDRSPLPLSITSVSAADHRSRSVSIRPGPRPLRPRAPRSALGVNERPSGRSRPRVARADARSTCGWSRRPHVLGCAGPPGSLRAPSVARSRGTVPAPHRPYLDLSTLARPAGVSRTPNDLRHPRGRAPRRRRSELGGRLFSRGRLAHERNPAPALFGAWEAL
jgi:hypothetical protein